ncbi:DUF6387 family protein [Chromobacterium vaccinii]|nr:DUF6387 family protein [Chromobacterium vaccinii]MBX9357843.1 DUF6387 family protein [Chromobacterium vaccinii]
MNTPSYRPKWFNIDNYSICEKFSRPDWMQAITYRQPFFIPRKSRSGFTVTFEGMPEIDKENKFDEYVFNFFKYRAESLNKIHEENKHEQLIEDPEIHPLELVIRNATPSDIHWRIKKIEQDSPDEFEEVKNAILDGSRCQSNPKFPVSDMNDWLGEGLITVDLSAPDTAIHDALDIWLKHIREEVGRKDLSKRLFNNHDFSEWARLRIVAYIDLMQWSQTTGEKFTNAQIGNLLYPDEFEIDTTERVRKVLPIKAKEILNGTRRIGGC